MMQYFDKRILFNYLFPSFVCLFVHSFKVLSMIPSFFYSIHPFRFKDSFINSSVQNLFSNYFGSIQWYGQTKTRTPLYIYIYIYITAIRTAFSFQHIAITVIIDCSCSCSSSSSLLLVAIIVPSTLMIFSKESIFSCVVQG